jgi:hypothetical protein
MVIAEPEPGPQATLSLPYGTPVEKTQAIVDYLVTAARRSAKKIFPI